jgi:threonine dehydrogenase-like Zn-dependent dehydrogenase
MKAVVWHGVGDIRLDEVAEPTIKIPTDAVVRLTTSAICGTDLHMIRGTMSGMRNGVILGHEGVGIVEALGSDVRNLTIGDRVVIPSTLACGCCSYCRDGYYAQCDNANPKGPGTAFFGGPETAGGLNGLQAEKALIPNAHINLIKLPDNVSDEQAILLSDIFPTGYFGADLADIKPGHTVAVFGCGPVGLFTILSAQLMNAGRVIAIDNIPFRLAIARRLGAEVINFDDDEPVATIKRLTGGIGVDRVIDAVGVDANCPHHSFIGDIQDVIQGKTQKQDFQQEQKTVAPKQNPQDGNWEPGDSPSQVLRWAIEAVAKAGTLAIIGVYPPTAEFFPIGQAMNKNLTVRMGNCNHKKYIPQLIQLIQAKLVDPTVVLSQIESFTNVLDAYKSFDKREFGWTKVALTTG